MAGSWADIIWQGHPARAWVPTAIDSEAIAISVTTARRTEQAAAAVRRADDRLPGAWEAIARILLRTEGVASSNIEGLRAPITAVAASEAGAVDTDPVAAGIADNLAVVTSAIRSADQRLSVTALHRWHRQLMAHGDLPPAMVGHFRTAQGWIGGSSPRDAVFVPPPAEMVADLMADLVAFANRTDLDAVTQAAVLHGQFETIHPYGDGNGRLGRVLIGWLLARRLDVVLPPPVSVLIARDPGGYLSGLYQFRDGSLDAWVGWFADVAARAGAASVVLGERIRALLMDWETRLGSARADAGARRIVAVLPLQPVTNSALVAGALGVSERTARSGLGLLGQHGIVEPAGLALRTGGRPRAWWVARELLDQVGAWSD